MQLHYTLTWHSYPDYLREMMREMMTSEDFTDVTLVTDDKKTIKAHRNILSACSPVFKNILQTEIKNSHPVIYLRGIQYSEIESILQYIYLGETKISEKRMNEFLSVSKNLEIQELSKDVRLNSPQTDLSNQKKEYVAEANNLDHNKAIDQGLTLESEEEEVKGREITAVGSKFQCPQCDKLFSHNTSVHAHIRSVHEGVKYACNQCDYQATRQGLTIHIQSVHKGFRYACNQCDYQASSQSNLTLHIQSQHLGIKYACNQCDYQTTQQSHLKSHKKRKHF